MYDEIIEIAQNRHFLEAIRDGSGSGPNLNLLKRLPSWETESLRLFEESLETSEKINFQTIFHEPIGNYLIKCYLKADQSVDKAVFVNDVELYKMLHDPSARERVAKRMFERFCIDDVPLHLSGISVFATQTPNIPSPQPTQTIRTLSELSAARISTHIRDIENGAPDHTNPSNKENTSAANKKTPTKGTVSTAHDLSETQSVPELTFTHSKTNILGVYGKNLENLADALANSSTDRTLFDPIYFDVIDELKLDVFPRFLKSSLYKLYIQCKSMETSSVCADDFEVLRVLGRGAFGFVNACVKKDTGFLYAMKCINKRRVYATESLDAIMSERNFLADMDSKFVTGLKYAFMDGETLYFIMDLLVGGDLKFHLNKDTRFSVERSRFYAAEVLLGLESIHSKDIIYRDIKLENVLLDERGHCRISDLGLAIRTNGNRVRGYAGTPGYTAPEVVLNQPYDKAADFFSFGVMIYRFLSGKKPFQGKKKRRHGDRKHRSGSDLDRNVVELDPDYPDAYFDASARSLLRGLLHKDAKRRLGSQGIHHIKEHPWFDSIDFGLLEAGYLKPPFVPNQDEVNADSLRHIGRPNQDDKYARLHLSLAFEHSLRRFPFVSNVALQEEVVRVLEKADLKYNFEKFALSTKAVDFRRVRGEDSPDGKGSDVDKESAASQNQSANGCVPCSLL